MLTLHPATKIFRQSFCFQKHYCWIVYFTQKMGYNPMTLRGSNSFPPKVGRDAVSPIEIAWTVVGTVVALLVGTGYTCVGLAPPEFRRARGCFYLAAALLGGMEIVWYVQSGYAFAWRVAVATLICLVIGVGLPETLRWVHRREMLVIAPPPPPPTPPTDSAELKSGPPINPALARQILQKLEEIRKNSDGVKPQPSFLISSGPAVVSSKPENFGFFVSPEIPTQAAVGHPIGIEPVNLWVYAGVLNQQSVPTIIQGYKMEIKKKSKGWVKLQRVDTIGQRVYSALGSRRISPINADFFDRVIHHKSFMSGEPALGWMLFRYPDDLGEVKIGEYRLRITIYDPTGKKTTTELPITEDDTQVAAIDIRPAIEIPPGQELQIIKASKVESLPAKDSPRLKSEIKQVADGHFIGNDDDNLILAVGISNIGEPTTVSGWDLHVYDGDGQEHKTQRIYLPAGHNNIQAQIGGFIQVWSGDDDLAQKLATNQIGRNKSEVGILAFQVLGVPQVSKGFELRLYCQDITGVKYEAKHIIRGDPPNNLHVPGLSKPD